MKGEKQMIYKNIIFKAAPFSYDLVFDDRITLVGGDSGTGKTVLYEMLEDLRLTDEYQAIKLFNYKSDNLLESMKQCRGRFIVIDNADILIDDEVRISKTPTPFKFNTLYSEEEQEFKEFNYTPNMKRDICVIDPETTEELKPRLYYDENEDKVKGRCKLKPYKSYFAFEVRDDDGKV